MTIAIILIDPFEKLLSLEVFDWQLASEIIVIIIAIPLTYKFINNSLKNTQFIIEKNLKTNEFNLSIIKHLLFYAEKITKKGPLLEVIAKKPGKTHPRFNKLYFISVTSSPH